MGELQKNIHKKDLENRNVKRKKYLRDLEDYQNKQVFLWQSTLAISDVANPQPQTAADYNGDARTLHPQGQQYHQQQDIKQPNRGYPPYRQEDRQPYTPRRQPPRRPQNVQQGHHDYDGNDGRHSHYGHHPTKEIGVTGRHTIEVMEIEPTRMEINMVEVINLTTPPIVRVDNIIPMGIRNSMGTNKERHTGIKKIMDTNKERHIGEATSHIGVLYQFSTNIRDILPI